MVSFERRIIAKIRLLSWCNRFAWQQEIQWKTPFALALAAHNPKTKLVTSMSWLNSNILQTLKKSWEWIQSHLKFFKVALNPVRRIFCKVAESLTVACWLFSNNKKWGSLTLFSSWASKAKQKGVLHWIYRGYGNQLHQDNRQNLFSNNSSFQWYHIIVIRCYKVVQ